MIVRAGTGTSFLIEFPSGRPDGNIVWRLLGPDGGVIASDALIVPVGAVSIYLPVPAELNQLVPETLTSYRDLVWSYTVGGATVNGEVRYLIEGRIPIAASAGGVRNKLGIDDPVALPDHDISLVNAYLRFAGDVDLTNVDPSNIYVRDAVEALAALTLLPSLRVRLAKKEDSGTSAFERMTVDWDALAASLGAIVTEGYTAVDPSYDETGLYGALFILASPATDAFTGDAPAG